MKIKKNIKKRKSRMLWYGWISQASKKFGISKTAIQKRYEKNDIDLLTWIQNQLLIRKKQNENAKNLKDSFQNI